MTFRYDDEADYEPEEVEASQRRRWPAYLVVVMLAATGIGSAFLWRAYGGSGLVLPSFGSAAPTDAGDKVVVLRDLQALQQQIVAQSQATMQLLAAQQAETKRLADQMTALNAKLDGLQHSVASIQPPAAPPVSKPPPVRKKPAAPKDVETSPAGAPPPPPLQLTR